MTYSGTYSLSFRKELDRKLTITELDGNFKYLNNLIYDNHGGSGSQGPTGPQGPTGSQGSGSGTGKYYHSSGSGGASSGQMDSDGSGYFAGAGVFWLNYNDFNGVIGMP